MLEGVSRILKNTLRAFVTFALFFIVLELGSFGLGYVLHKLGSMPATVFEHYRTSFHPLLTGHLLGTGLPKPLIAPEHGWNEYDPWLGHRNLSGNSYAVYSTDSLGFIHNGNPDRNLHLKPENMVRIFILGGSTVAGHGVFSPTRTIAARLENLLNTYETDDSRRYQVINAGVAGYNSAAELAYLAYEILYYQPDVVIALDGYNDLARGCANTTINPREDRYHWTSAHAALNQQIKHPDPKIIVPEKWQVWRYFYFTELFLQLNRSERGPAWTAISENATPTRDERIPAVLRKRHPSMTDADFAPVEELLELDYQHWIADTAIERFPALSCPEKIRYFTNNVRFMRSACEALDVHFLSVLQPALLPEHKPIMTSAEGVYFDSRRQSEVQKIKLNYPKILFQNFETAARQLEQSLGEDFLDMTRLFVDTEETVYYDWAHYNAAGNQRIAEHLIQLLQERGILEIGDKQ